jgi:hypothetical protein
MAAVYLKLTAATTIMQRQPARMADIRGTSFIGCTAVRQSVASIPIPRCI